MFKFGVDCEVEASNWEKEDALMNKLFEQKLKTEVLKTFKSYCKRMGWEYSRMVKGIEITHNHEFILHATEDFQNGFYYYDTSSKTKYGTFAIGLERFMDHVEGSFIDE